MYNNAYNPAGSQLTNNPFINDPTHPHTRFPDISSSSPGHDTQYTSWLQPSRDMNFNASPMPQTGAYQQPPYQQQQQQQPAQYNAPFRSFSPQQTSRPFQPTSSFGQQLNANINGSSYGYLQGQSTGMPPPQSGYNPAQQQIQNNPGYVAQFDPYASIGQGWEGQSQPQSYKQPQSPTQSSFSTLSSGNPHPREYIRTHKPEIESWDSYAWKQLLNSFDALKDAWGARKEELSGKITQLQMQLQYGGGAYYAGQIQQEGSRLQGLYNESQSNFDSVAASSFQMREVFQGYRQSGDLASKRRVREASNAAIQSLPDWPSQSY